MPDLPSIIAEHTSRGDWAALVRSWLSTSRRDPSVIDSALTIIRSKAAHPWPQVAEFLAAFSEDPLNASLRPPVEDYELLPQIDALTLAICGLFPWTGAAEHIEEFSPEVQDVAAENATTASLEAVALAKGIKDDELAALLLMSASNALGASGRKEESERAAKEAVDLYTEFSGTNVETFLPYLAVALNNWAICLVDLDRREVTAVTQNPPLRVESKPATDPEDSHVDRARAGGQGMPWRIRRAWQWSTQSGSYISKDGRSDALRASSASTVERWHATCARVTKDRKPPIRPPARKRRSGQNQPFRPPGRRVARACVCNTSNALGSGVEQGLTAQRIYQDLVLEVGFQGSYQSVKRYVRRLRRSDPQRFERLESHPGEEAQVDFGAGPVLVDSEGRRRKSWVIRVVLSHSRKGYSEAIHHQTTENFIRCLENSFRKFGGVPHTVVIDNLRAAVKRADWFEPELNPKIEEFSRHYLPAASTVLG